MKRSVRQRGGRLIKRIIFGINRLMDRVPFPWGDLGLVRLSISPVTYHSSLPSRSWLKKHPEMWQRPTSLPGVEWDLEAQFEWLEWATGDYLPEIGQGSLVEEIEQRGIRFRYGLTEAELLYCVVRQIAPKRVLELGSGASTAVVSDASHRNQSEGRGATAITCVDPFAASAVADLEGVEVRSEYAQMLPIEAFEVLQSGDLLFIDSSHVVKTGSELPRIYLEGIPSLAPGVFIHIHDVHFPYLFRPEVLDDFWDFQESTLLAGLLTHNPRIGVLCALSALQDHDSERLSALIPDLVPGERDRGIAQAASRGKFPSSIWLETK